MSIKLISQVLDSTLPSTEKFVAVVYADHANDEGDHIYPSIGKTAKKTSYDPRTVRRATRNLEELGILMCVGQRADGRNEYKMVAQNLPRTDDPTPPDRRSYPPGQTILPPRTDDPTNRNTKKSIKSPDQPPKGPNWDGLNFGEGNGEITEAEIVLPQQEPIKAQFDNGKLSSSRGASPDPWQEPPVVTQSLQPEPKPKKGKAKKPVEPITFALPDPINTPQVIQLLNDFEANRREIGKPMTQRAANMLVESISDLCIPEIVVRLRTAITRNWLGVRFPGDDYQYAQYRNGGNGNGRAYTNGATKQNGQQTAVKTWKPGGSY